MAIQVSGTAVISDARALTNITSIDGTTATSISAAIAGIPTGVIAIWSGSVVSIPSGWLICDGTNATPDLRNRFVIGAGSTYAVAATGGATTTSTVVAHTHTVSGNTSNIGNHTHTGTTSTIGNHTHNVSKSNYEGNNGMITGAPGSNVSTSGGGSHSHTFTTDGGGSHSHSFTGNAASTGSASVSILNPYYALCYIMKT